jgi:hypothetical protein
MCKILVQTYDFRRNGPNNNGTHSTPNTNLNISKGSDCIDIGNLLFLHLSAETKFHQ